MSSKILFTGALGSLGSRLIPFLSKHHDLILSDLKPFESEHGEVRPCDLTDFDAVRKLVEGAGVIVHGAIAPNRWFMTREEQFMEGKEDKWHAFHECAIEVNLRGTYHLMEAAARAGIRKFVFLSSLTTVMGEPRYERVWKDTPDRPLNFYAVTKKWGEDLGEYYSRKYDMEVICLRIGQPYLVGHATEEFAAEQGRYRSAMTHLEDAAEAVECALRSEGIRHIVVNVVSESEHRRFDLSEGQKIGFHPRKFCLENGKMCDWITPLWDGPTITLDEYRIAVVSTSYRALSHTDVIVSRWLHPCATDKKWGWEQARGRMATLFTEQKPFIDLSEEAARLHQVKLCDSIDDALTQGGDELAVDAVILIGEHGTYPTNRYGQKLYPRKELFDQITAVFRRTGRAVPVFSDKHLSWNFEWAKEMVETARELGFPLQAGSTLPLCRWEPEPPADLFQGLEEGVIFFYGPRDAYGYHSIEWMLSVCEKRGAREQGLVRIRTWAGEELKEAWRSGQWNQALALQAAGDFLEREVRPEEIEKAVDETPEAAAYQFEYADGLKVTHLKLDSLVRKFTGAFRNQAGTSAAFLPVMGQFEEFAAHFALLNGCLDEFFSTGKPFMPIERILLSSGATAKVLRSLVDQPGEWVETPELKIEYETGR